MNLRHTKNGAIFGGPPCRPIRLLQCCEQAMLMDSLLTY